MASSRIKGLKNLYFDGKSLYTLNSTPGNAVYGEDLIKIKDVEYRFWDPYRSKLAALILNGCKQLPINETSNILYLGAASGTTASHLADIIVAGRIYCIEFSHRSFRDLINVANERENLIPILENANYPNRYKPILENVDIIYQDISQRDQVRIFDLNAKQILKPGNFGIFMVKSRSIDITKAPKAVFEEVFNDLKLMNYQIVEYVSLEPYSKDHIGIIIKIR